MAAFTVTRSTCRDHALLAVVGELDLATIDLLAEHGINQLLEPAVATVVLDLGRVTFTDASGLGTLVRLGNVARHVNKQLLLIRVPACVRRLLDLTGLDGHFEQHNGELDDSRDASLTRGYPDGQAA